MWYVFVAAAVLGWIISAIVVWALARSEFASGGARFLWSIAAIVVAPAALVILLFYKALVDQGALALVALWVASWAASAYFLLGGSGPQPLATSTVVRWLLGIDLVASPALVVLALLLFAASGSGSSPAARPFNSSAMEVRSAGARLSQIERRDRY